MKGFIVASVNVKNIKQSAGLNQQMITYTPVISGSAEEIKDKFKDRFPNQIVLLTIPLDVMEKNIDLLHQMADNNNVELTNSIREFA